MAEIERELDTGPVQQLVENGKRRRPACGRRRTSWERFESVRCPAIVDDEPDELTGGLFGNPARTKQ